MITIDHIRFAYGRRRAAVFDDFSLSLESDCIYGLLGKNGTGKSTLLYLIAGLLLPSRGSIRYLGAEPRLRRPETLSELYLLPEEFTLPKVRLAEYVALHRPFYPRFSDELLRQCLADFDLAPDLHLGELSMGQRKKAYISFALATNTRLLLMDEPTNGLDIPSKSQFRRVVARSMTEGRTLLISTHQVRDIDTLLDHVVMLDGSRVLLNRPTADICAALRFDEVPVGSAATDALYAQPSPGGQQVVRRNDGTAETPLNLELLFNAMLDRPDLGREIFSEP